MQETPTPRTDKICNNYAGDPSCMDFCDALKSECRALERELADVTTQRDRLAEALRDMVDISIFEEWATATTGKQIVFKSANAALAAVEGGKIED